MRAVLLLSLAVCLLSGCSTPYRPPVFAAKVGGSASFPGAAELLDAQRGQGLNVILVHGMCTHTEEWAQGAAKAFIEGMGEDGTRLKLDPVAVDGSRIELFQRSVQIARRGIVHLSAILWSPVTAPLKRQLCYDQTERTGACAAPAYPYQRPRVNRLIKDNLFDDCLADAIIYQGKSRARINAQMQAAIQKAVGVAPDAKNLFITDSLGSKIAFDALYIMTITGATAHAGQRIFDNTPQIFMRANQIPILALADMTLPEARRTFSCDSGSDAYPADPIGDLVRRRGCPGAQRIASPPLVVAFSDPADVLSYSLAGSLHEQTEPYPVVDVIVSNAPDYLGLIERPDLAHLGYVANPDVNRLIGCGNGRPGYCAAPAR